MTERAWRTALLSATAATVLSAVSAHAVAQAQQGRASAVTPVRTSRLAPRTAARTVYLSVAPEPGDVLAVSVRQTIEMGNGVGSTSTGPRRDARPHRVTVTEYYARSTVERTDDGATMLSTVTDSLFVHMGQSGAELLRQRVPMNSTARPTRIRVHEDGAMTVVDGPTSPSTNAGAINAALSAMPPMLPDGPVSVGDSWEREIALPPLPFVTHRADGAVHTVFRLDSITRGGRDAWVSVHGSLRRDGAVRDLPAGTRVIAAGTMEGTLHLDRVRGWITDAATVIVLQSEFVGNADAAPTPAPGVRITQRLQVK